MNTTLFHTNFGNTIRKSKITGFTVLVLQSVFDMKPYIEKHNQLRIMELGTVGREVSEMLDKFGYELIPQFENHDLKHLLLGYQMTIEDEVRMQAFLVGNGNHSLPCYIFLSLGLFMPEIWKDMMMEYKKGKDTKPVYFLTLENTKNNNLLELRNEYFDK
jgi:hypothetical protein